MPQAKYTGSPSGSGNPPGKHSPGYTSDPGAGAGNFNRKKSYRSDMHVGMSDTAPVVGNQPKEQKSSEPMTNNPALR